jgi:imidazolonepropionase-like amidohydrolase
MLLLKGILCAAHYAADLRGQSARAGGIQVGRYADLAVEGDPLTDITRLQHISLIVKEGQVYKSDGRAVEQ